MRPETTLLDEVIALALRDIAREQTDFLGRMGQCLGAYDAILDESPDGNLSGEQRDDAVEEITGLCALALAQLAMLRFPEDPAALLCSASLPEPQLGVGRPWHQVDAHRDLSRILPDVERKIKEAKRIYAHCLPAHLFAPIEGSLTELNVLRHELSALTVTSKEGV